MSFIHPTPEQQQAMANGPDGNVVMLNLLRFRRDESGEPVGFASYMKYSELVAPMLEKVGGSLVWGGRADHVFIGDGRDDWDTVMLVKYPSRAAFIEMTSSQEYLAIHHHREEGLETSALVACTPGVLI
jgi:uncharacterized protein (DUF1330 family)